MSQTREQYDAEARQCESLTSCNDEEQLRQAILTDYVLLHVERAVVQLEGLMHEETLAEGLVAMHDEKYGYDVNIHIVLSKNVEQEQRLASPRLSFELLYDLEAGRRMMIELLLHSLPTETHKSECARLCQLPRSEFLDEVTRLFEQYDEDIDNE